MRFRIKNFFLNYKRNNEGATAVEFALFVLPFILMLFGIIEAGRMVWIMNAVQYAVEDTARYAALYTDSEESTLQEHAETILTDMMVPADPLSLEMSNFTSSSVDFVEINGSYTVETLLSQLLPADFGNFSFEADATRPLIE